MANTRQTRGFYAGRNVGGDLESSGCSSDCYCPPSIWPAKRRAARSAINNQQELGQKAILSYETSKQRLPGVVKLRESGRSDKFTLNELGLVGPLSPIWAERNLANAWQGGVYHHSSIRSSGQIDLSPAIDKIAPSRRIVIHSQYGRLQSFGYSVHQSQFARCDYHGASGGCFEIALRLPRRSGHSLVSLKTTTRTVIAFGKPLMRALEFHP